MSSRGGGGGGGSGGGGGGGGLAEGSRVSIPDNAKQTIQSIREITGKQHSDEEIYATLKECSMDPNETAQKLLYMDTFHDVKRKRDKKKETPVTQGRGGPGSRGNYNSLSGRDAGGGRNAFPRRENGVNRNAYRVKNNAQPRRTRSPTAIPNGTGRLPNGSSSHGCEPQSSIDNRTSETKDGTVVGESTAAIPAQSFSSLLKGPEKFTSNLNASATSTISPAVPVVSSSASSDPVSAPTVSRSAGAMDATKPEVSHLQVAAEIDVSEIKHVPRDIDVSEIEKTVPEVLTPMHGKEEPSKSKVAEHVEQPKTVEQVVTVTPEVANVIDNANSQLLAGSNVRNGQHVTFPTHFQVSEALKNGLTFGSFDASFGQVSKHSSAINFEINSARPVETSQGGDETAGESASRSQGILLPAEEGDDADQQAPPELEKVPESDGNESSDADMNASQSNQEAYMYADYNQPAYQNVPGYGLGFIPTPLTNLAQFDGPEAQSQDVYRLTNFVGGNPPAPSSSSTPPIQNTVAAAPQVHIIRHPFPPSYIPYHHYYSPYYMQPMHQFLSPTGIPQQSSTGNVYMPPGATPPGVKFPISQFKPVSNAGNPAHLAIPSGYAPLTSPPIGISLPVPSVTSGSSSSKEDISAMQSKENHIYTAGPPNEGSALWMPAPGQEISNMQMNSFYNLSIHGQQVPYSPAQAGHGAFGGLYQTPPQTMAAPSNVNPLLQQSQPMAAAVGTVGPPTGPYHQQQQPQLAQVNWKSNF